MSPIFTCQRTLTCKIDERIWNNESYWGDQNLCCKVIPISLNPYFFTLSHQLQFNSFRRTSLKVRLGVFACSKRRHRSASSGWNWPWGFWRPWGRRKFRDYWFGWRDKWNRSSWFSKQQHQAQPSPTALDQRSTQQSPSQPTEPAEEWSEEELPESPHLRRKRAQTKAQADPAANEARKSSVWGWNGNQAVGKEEVGARN